MMLPLLLLASQVTPTSQAVFNGRDSAIHVPIPRDTGAVSLDGELAEGVWRRAALLTGFSQYRPVDGRPAADSTEVLVWYDETAIYFGIRAIEAHGDVIRATLAERDRIDQDDNIQILLDTFNDRRRALLFAVNPLGVQQDGVRSEGQAGSAGGPGAGGRFDGFVDVNPDFVFESQGRVFDGGYEVEVRIPFRNIRFQNANPQDWGIQVIRITQHNGFEATWTETFRANASFLGQSGRLTGLTDMERGLVLNITPEVTTQARGARVGSEYEYEWNPEAGGTVAWGITTNLGLNGTAESPVGPHRTGSQS